MEEIDSDKRSGVLLYKINYVRKFSIVQASGLKGIMCTDTFLGRAAVAVFYL